jgi:intein/homing endonuclease
MVKINDWVYKDVEGSDGTVSERLPIYDVELAISIQPSGAYELQISQVRQWIQALKNSHDLNVKAVTYDGQTGFESIELLRKSGIRADTSSVDRSTEAYDTLKEALYDGRLILPPNDILAEELKHLKLIKRGEHTKIDHDRTGCFVGETMISMADGTAKRIDDVRNGDDILSFDVKNTYVDTEKAINPRITKYTKELIEISLNNGLKIRCTPEHRFLLKTGMYKEAKDLTLYDIPMTLQFSLDDYTVINGKKHIQLEEAVPVYDISCYINSNFIIHNGPIVHNSNDISDAVAGAILLAKNMRGNLRQHDIKVNAG